MKNESPKCARRVIGLDNHPDTATLQITERPAGRRIKKVGKAHTIRPEELPGWCAEYAQPGDVFVLEASCNSFATAGVIKACGYEVQVLESAAVNSGRKKTKNDNDQVAAYDIAKYYWKEDEEAVTVWQPDATTRIYRAVLSRYLDSVKEKTRHNNRIISFLTGYGIRKRELDKASIQSPKKRSGFFALLPSEMEKQLLADMFETYDAAVARYEKNITYIQYYARRDKRVLACLRIPGIGLINAFALVAVIGDISRFETPAKLASYIGLSPKSHQSGNGGEKCYGLCGDGRRDLRALLTEAANHLVGISGKKLAIRKWALKMMMRKQYKGTVIIAVARKLSSYAWHALNGRAVTEEEARNLTDCKARWLVAYTSKEEARKMGYASLKEMRHAMAELIRDAIATSSQATESVA